MMNENAADFFLMPYRDKADQPRFSKAKRPDAVKRIKWSWDTITGKAKFPASVASYPTNAKRESRWAALDVDAHDGYTTRARDLALEAFRILYRQEELFVALTTSAGDLQRTGFHLFTFSREFHPCGD
jgi:hypothetical protein